MMGAKLQFHLIEDVHGLCFLFFYCSGFYNVWSLLWYFSTFLLMALTMRWRGRLCNTQTTQNWVGCYHVCFKMIVLQMKIAYRFLFKIKSLEWSSAKKLESSANIIKL